MQHLLVCGTVGRGVIVPARMAPVRAVAASLPGHPAIGELGATRSIAGLCQAALAGALAGLSQRIAERGPPRLDVRHSTTIAVHLPPISVSVFPAPE